MDWSILVAHDGLFLRNAPDELQADREVVLAAVAQNGYALEHASAELKVDREVILAAVAQYGGALEHAAAVRTDGPGGGSGGCAAESRRLAARVSSALRWAAGPGAAAASPRRCHLSGPFAAPPCSSLVIDHLPRSRASHLQVGACVKE